MIKLILLSAVLFISTFGATYKDRYSYLDRCNVATVRDMGSNVLGINYNCGTPSIEFEKKTLAAYRVDKNNRVIINNPYRYDLLEDDGSYTEYSDPEQDGLNGNEITVPITTVTPILPNNYMRG